MPGAMLDLEIGHRLRARGEAPEGAMLCLAGFLLLGPS